MIKKCKKYTYSYLFSTLQRQYLDMPVVHIEDEEQHHGYQEFVLFPPLKKKNIKTLVHEYLLLVTCSKNCKRLGTNNDKNNILRNPKVL